MTTANATPRRALTDQEHELFLQNIGLIYRVVRRHQHWPRPWMRRYPTVEDAFQTGCIGLITAIKRHDPARGAFTTIAWKAISHALVNEAFGDRPDQLTARAVGGDDAHDALAARPDPQPGPLLQAVRRDLRRKVRQAVRALPTGERDAVVETVLAGRTLSDLAQRQGVTRQAVHRVRQRGLAELRRRLWRCDPAA